MRPAPIRRWLLAAALLASPSAYALNGFSPLVNLPGDVKVADARVTNYDQANVSATGSELLKVGKVTVATMAFQPEGNRPADATWKAWAPLLQKAGWKVSAEEGGRHLLTRKDPDGERALAVYLGDYNDPKLILVEPVAKPPTLELKPPAANAKPEQVPEAQDFPYLPAYPGAKLSETTHRDEDMLATLPGTQEMSVLARGMVQKSYQPPPTLSAFELETVMRDALTKAGWEVLPAEDPKHPTGQLMAHYGKNGRDIWAWLLRAADDSGAGLRYYVADVGNEDWAKDLQAKCRLTLVGVNFDFNKATLRPESNSALEKAAATLKAVPRMKIEVQGHTDNVGDDAYNDKLSGQRAETVRAWLAAHGIPAERLTAKGYGKRVPIADNDSDAGRAKNRRVDLTCAK